MKYQTLEIKTVWNSDPKLGGLSFVEGERDIPFPISRIFCIHKSDENMYRENFISRENPMLLFCPYGEVDIELSDREETESVLLNNPAKGLILNPDAFWKICWHCCDAVLCVVEGGKATAASSIRYDAAATGRGEAGNVLDCKKLQFTASIQASLPSGTTMTSSRSVVLESLKDVPFEIQRIFYIFGRGNVGKVRGKHANRKSEFVLFNISGKSKVKVIDEDMSETIYELNGSRDAVYLPTMIWKEMYDFTPDSVMMVVTNAYYDNEEYIRDFDEFAEEIRDMKKEFWKQDRIRTFLGV